MNNPEERKLGEDAFRALNEGRRPLSAGSSAAFEEQARKEQKVDDKAIADLIAKDVAEGPFPASTKGKKNYPRMSAIYLLRRWVKFSNKQIATCLTSIKPRTVSALIKRAQLMQINDEEFKHHIMKLELLIFTLNHKKT